MADTGVAVGTIVAIGSGPAFAGGSSGRSSAARPRRPGRLATALALAGVAVLALAGAEATISLPGVGLALLAGASYAGYTLAAKQMVEDGHRPETVMAGAFGLGAVVLLPVLRPHRRRLAHPARRVALALFLGIVPTALAYVLFARGLRRLARPRRRR